MPRMPRGQHHQTCVPPKDFRSKFDQRIRPGPVQRAAVIVPMWYRDARRCGRWLLVIAALLLPLATEAHKVIAGVYAIGTLIDGEVGFSNGDMARPGTRVEVFGADGEKLGETTIEADGLFSFAATRRVEHRFRANLGAGHVMDISLPAAELPRTLAGAEDPAAGAVGSLIASADAATLPAVVTASMPESSSGPGSDLEALVQAAVASQIAPLRRELAAYKEQAKWHDVLGGIGYIFGLFGVAAWLQSRRPTSSLASARAKRQTRSGDPS